LEEGVWGRNLLKVSPQLAQPQCLKMRHPIKPMNARSQAHTQPPRNRARLTKRLLREKAQPKNRRPHAPKPPSGRFGNLHGELLAEGTEGSFQLVEPGSVPEI